MDKFNHKDIEAKWQKIWEEKKVFRTPSTSLRAGGEDTGKPFDSAQDRPKYYVLDMFPYPSGLGLHIGHVKGYSATDVLANMKRMQGFNVLHPMGWDAFGLPAENFAIKNKTHPKFETEKNVAYFKKQMRELGFSYDWEREINTTDPEYYKWSQWAFIKMWEKGLAYESWEPIIWCPKCQTGLAMEDLEDGKCERCESEVERKPMRQWVIKITDYADRLLADLDKLPGWEDSIKEMQRNWIGRSEGAQVNFDLRFTNSDLEKNSPIICHPERSVAESKDRLTVFTTRPDTLFGVTYVVLAPENPLVENLKSPLGLSSGRRQISNFAEVEEYIKKTKAKSDLERTDLNKDKSGVKLEGVMAINPANNEEVPVFIADYVLANYGTGAVMAVPAHDERDWEFAKKYNLNIKHVVASITSSENREKTFLLIHGFGGNSEENWLPWFKGEFENMGYKVLIPNLPDTENPKLENWIKALSDLKKDFSGELYVIGHSLGAFAACKFAEQAGVKIKKIILVAPTGKRAEDLSKVKQAGFSDKETEIVSSFMNTDFDWKKIRDNVENSVIYLSENDPYVLTSMADNYKELCATVKTFKDKGHFNKKAGILELPEIIFDLGVAAFTNDGKSINSDFLNGLSTSEAKTKMIAWLEENNHGQKKVNYKLQDWVFSRQRYWGEPIPFVHCEKCGTVPVPESELPIRLPDVENYEPSGTGESPLANITEWVNTTCPKCGGPARRETNTMPQWAGSSWYYLRYIDPHNSEALVDKVKEKYWSPVDFYVGGAEHATRHLIYARFWHKFLFDIGVVNFEEPFKALQHVGLVLGSDGKKISKRLNNGANPLDVAAEYGADALRCYENFMGPFNQPCVWSNTGPLGVRRFLDKTWSLSEKFSVDSSKEIKNILHKTIKKVSEDIADFKLNTCISSLMILANAIEEKGVAKEDYAQFIQILSPFAPHLAEEIWREKLGNQKSIFKSAWPIFDPELIKDETVNLIVQVNGKLRATISVPAEISQDEAVKLAGENENVKKYLDGKEIIKIIFVAGKLLNIVVK